MNNNMRINFDFLLTFDTANGILRAWWIDPLLASISFASAVYLFSYQEKKLGLSRFRTWHEFCYSGDGRCILMESLSAYWIGIFFWKIFVPPPGEMIPDGIPNSVESLFWLIAEVSSGIVLYDAYFFFIHWGMHECKYLRIFCHKEHHGETKYIEARHVLHHSLLDGSMQVLINIMVQRCTPWGDIKSRLARALHNIIVTWMLTESHTSSPYPNIFRKHCTGVRNHRFHHLGTSEHVGENGVHHGYQQFFGYLDNTKAWYYCKSTSGLKIRMRNELISFIKSCAQTISNMDINQESYLYPTVFRKS